MQQERERGGLRAGWERIRKDKRSVYLLYAALLLLALLLCYAGNRSCSFGDQSDPDRNADAFKRDRLEQRLIDVLSKIRGAGKVDVLITYETTGETVAAMSSRTEEDVRDAVSGADSTTSRSLHSTVEPATIKTDAGQEPIILIEKEPVVRGVVIVAEGAADLAVRLNLMHAAQAATGVSSGQIEVLEMGYEP